MRKLINVLLSLFVVMQLSIPCTANSKLTEHNIMTKSEISVESEEFIEMKSCGLIPDEVISYIERAERENPNAKISLITTISENEKGMISYTNYRTYGNHELADWIVHVTNAHDMQNIISGNNAGGFCSTMLFAAATNSISYVIPFYSYAVTASMYLLGNTPYTANPGNKLNAAPAYDTYCKFTFVKWNGNWSLGVQSFYATLTTISWYLYLQSTNMQYSGVLSYNISLASNYYNNPDYTAVQYYQSGGLIEQRPTITIGNAQFNLY